jgi:acyl-coenzyme A synthetase/AMP-(fatty) acid ligase
VNVVEAFFFQARQAPTVAAIGAPGTRFNVVSYGRLQAMVNNVARNILGQGLRSGDVVAVFVGDQILQAAIILALARLGMVVVGGTSPQLPKECAVTATLWDAPVTLQNFGRAIKVDAMWTMGDGAAPEAHLCAGGGDLPCFIGLTSGSTGQPKAVVLSHDDVLRRVMRHNVVWGSRLPQCSRIFCDLSVSTLLGFLFLIHALSRGGALFLRGPEAPDTLQAFDLYKVQAMVAAPSALAEFLSYYEASPGFPSPFEAAVSVGSLLSSALSARFRSRVCVHLIASYGSTEGHIAAAAPAHQIADIDHAVGFVTPGVTVEVVDPTGAPRPAGQYGRVRIRSEYQVAGYLGAAENSAEQFRDGWFYPGDIGTVTKDNLLIISGREDAVINVGGDKVNPERIEAVVLAFERVRDAAALGIPGAHGIMELGVAVVWRDEQDETGLRRHCEAVLPHGLIPRRLIAVPQIPKNSMGKIDRARLLEAMASSK